MKHYISKKRLMIISFLVSSFMSFNTFAIDDILNGINYPWCSKSYCAGIPSSCAAQCNSGLANIIISCAQYSGSEYRKIETNKVLCHVDPDIKVLKAKLDLEFYRYDTYELRSCYNEDRPKYYKKIKIATVSCDLYHPSHCDADTEVLMGQLAGEGYTFLPTGEEDETDYCPAPRL
ncbi:hypothetical protein [Pseudoalteromonas denitrificans]|uniref:Uncharacterized protein n=1 Tax=Pseudoalteromonas denitrificans DSM 6059 TaxID=1123010 RepID=A0A1I1TXH8_9GAMM|nr:hypothetical protein [Pseudoalteromonas denitrificans]SFD63307.1 hypothetical protein SAMN02745724_05035 [Pseudoalteromonas denitrificans DSM 6059]